MQTIGLGRAALAAALVAGVAAVAASAAGPYVVDTGMASLGTAQTRVLTTAGGLTLYYSTADTATKSACTDGWCAKLWSPLLSASAPTSDDPLPGTLSAVRTANGSQVAYNGHLLYTYAGDTVAGQTNGQGVAGRWWVATPDLKPAPSVQDSGTNSSFGAGNNDNGGGGTGGAGGGGMGGGGGHY